ncbi:rhodanese-like domain-containing protein [Bacillus luteolus]|uniref:Rhodanese-like domain-containing protein n=1 Tax=Litchfieldia luteola TaxID=682179 RepID=A0ABR9QLT9_9BACI|nr:rhodanese-like domain-containing protein [Cytobacillus luteolus]MBE4909465.1 rhodanese-like domain-containing protein [Cytobacillus luteolus]MBP1940866.1 rhodanese-related sulfurtransferase [Cytobacillus luteolus]
MDYLNYILIGLLILFLLQRLLPTKGVRQITTADLRKELNDKNKQYIDVRTPGEFKGRNIKGFKNIPLHQLASKASELSIDKEVVVICQSGMRSNKATKVLRKQGFNQVTNVKGGMSAWV